MDTVLSPNATQGERLSATIAFLQRVAQDYAPLALGTAFGVEGCLLVHLISQYAPQVKIFSIDTGRLPQETYDVAAELQSRYGVDIHFYLPNAADVESFVNHHGINGFRDSVALRKQCCSLRKVMPLERALYGCNGWMTGLRREHSEERADLSAESWHEGYQLHKVNPLIDWTTQEVWQVVHDEHIPYNRLYDQGYASIGCAGCTRPITVGEEMRAGRWWWEQGQSKECGLHVSPAQRPPDWSI